MAKPSADLDAAPEATADTRRAQLAGAQLYLIVESRPQIDELEVLLTAALSAGVKIVQLRDKEQPDEVTVETGMLMRQICDRFGALLILNDRPDLAIACAADGVHVGQDDISVAEARLAVGEQRLVGLSTHSPQQIAAAGGVDYIGVGPVWQTPTKQGRPAVGLQLVEHAAQNAQVPFFAIGGIDQSNVGAVLAAGAERVAVVRAINDAVDPGAAAGGLARAIQEHSAVDSANSATN